MANIYVRSTDGSDADSGATWALAKATIAGAAAIDAAGDTIYLSQSHAESTGAVNLAMSFAGTLAAPTRVLGGNDGAEPPTALSAAPTITTTGVSAIQVIGNLYAYGLTLLNGSGATGGSIQLQNSAGSVLQTWENCSFRLGATNVANQIRVNNNSGNCVQVIWRNCRVKFGATGQRIAVDKARLIWEGGSVESGGSTPSSLFTLTGTGGASLIEVSGVDFSNFTNAFNMLLAQPGTVGRAVFRNCRMPTSWVGAMFNGALTVPGFRGEMYGCDDGVKAYQLWVEDYFGTIKHISAASRTGGASDGTTALCWAMLTANADGKFPWQRLESPEIVRWNGTIGSAITVTVDVIHDSATNLKDDEIWLEVQYLGSGSFTQASFINDGKADILATGADQTTSSATWTGLGSMTNPNKQKLSVTFTPQAAGFLIARVCLAKASTSYLVYVDPLLQIT